MKQNYCVSYIQCFNVLYILLKDKGSFKKSVKLDRGSIRSSLRDGLLLIDYRLTKRNIVGMLHHVLIHIGDLHLFLPALNLSILDADICHKKVLP